MKSLSSTFLLGAGQISQFPAHKKPEIAFVGRSNVGKSSLLNSLLLQKGVARVSARPGKTQEINFYEVEGKWVFVDLPGFGYAVVDKVKRAHWTKVNTTYLHTREQLALVCLLIDSRHDPMESDLGLIENLENDERKFVIILTKNDKISKKAQEERHQQVKELVQFCQNCVDVISYSAKTEMGRDQLLAIIKRESLKSHE
jgi:GTP-binding protein